MIIKTILLVVGIVLFHKFVYPFILGFMNGYRDAKDGKPYNDKTNDN